MPQMKFSAAFLFIILMIGFPAMNPPIADAQPLPTVRLAFDKPFYSPTDMFNATGTVTNSSADTLRYNKLTLSVFPAIRPGALVTEAFEKPGPPIIEQNRYLTLPPGNSEISLTRNIESLGLAEGVYPAEIKLSIANHQTLVDHTFLVVLDPKDRQMPTAIVWNLHQGERRLPDGTFFDDHLAELVSDKPENPGLLTKQLTILAENPTVKVNLAVDPTLLEQLMSMVDGYELRKEEQTEHISKNDVRTVGAINWLKALKKSVADNQVETISIPYGRTSLPTLAALGWTDDISKQLRMARRISGPKKLRLPRTPVGLYLSSPRIDKKTASLALKTGFEYAIAAPEKIGGGKFATAPRQPLEFKEGRRRLKMFTGDPEIAEWLLNVSPEKSSQELTALLAQRFLAGTEGDILTIAPKTSSTLPSPELLQQIYITFAQTPWVQTISLSSAPGKAGRPLRFQATRRLSKSDESYFAALKHSRGTLLDFAAAVSPKNDLRLRLERQLYIAESIDYLSGGKSDVPPIGKIYIEDIKDSIKREFAKLELAPPSNITFSTRTGKVPIVIVNRTGYPIRVRLKLSGKDFVFSDDKNEQVTLMPKENLISYHVTAGFVGISKLRVRLLVGNHEIAGRNLEVRVSSLLRYLVVSITTVLIIGITFMVFFKRRAQ